VLSLAWDKGTIIIRGPNVPKLPFIKYDPRARVYRTLGIHYEKLKGSLDALGIEYEDHVMNTPQCSINVKRSLELRDYQRRALDEWLRLRRGVVVMPTGMGKTHVGIAAVATLRVPTMVIVPTVELLSQWAGRLEYYLETSVGKYYGEVKEEGCVTVITYDSAYIAVERLGNVYPLLIFDEVHHLPSEGYRQIAELSASPYRLGLTATPERSDGRHVDLEWLVGPVVYSVDLAQARGRYVSDFEVEVISVELSNEERARYVELVKRYREFLKASGLKFSGPGDFQKLVRLASRNRDARDALGAWHEARRIAIMASRKLDVVGEILMRHRNDRVIVFTEYSDLSHEVSRRYLIPEVTHETPKEEREAVMGMFRRGEVKAIVTGKVLEEGIDVPDVNVVVILGGTSSRRQYVQRIGRALRLKPGKAKVYEIITRGTREVMISRRRRIT